MFQCLVDTLDSLDSIRDLNNSRSAANVFEIGFQIRGFHGGALLDNKKPGFLVKPGFYFYHQIISVASSQDRKPVQMIAYSAF